MKLFTSIFFSVFIFSFFSQGIAQEGDFQIDISSEKSLKEIQQELAEQFNDGDSKKLFIAFDLDNITTQESDTNLTKAHLVWDKHAAKKHGQYMGYPRNYVSQLNAQEQGDIRYIITFLANNHILKIAAHRNELETIGERIDHVHPLNFLGYAFSNEELKICFRNIRSKGWIWGDFIGGIKESLMSESKVENIKDGHIRDFSKKVSCDCNSIYPLVYPAIQNRNWDEFIDILITKIPRSGDYDRYDD